MYGDNRRIILGATGILLFILIILFSLMALFGGKERTPRERPAREVTTPDRADSDGAGGPEAVGTEAGPNREEAFYLAFDYWDALREAAPRAEDFPEPDRGDWAFLGENGLSLVKSSQAGRWVVSYREGGDSYPVVSLVSREGRWVLEYPGSDEPDFGRPGNREEKLILRRAEILREQRAVYDESIDIFNSLIDRGELRALAEEQGCYLETEREGDEVRSITVLTWSEDRPVLRLSYDMEGRYLNGEPIAGTGEVYRTLALERLGKADVRREREILHDESLGLIRSMYADEAFAAFLEERGLYPRRTVRRDEDFAHVDLVDGSGKVRGSFGVKNRSGQIWLFSGEGVPLVSLDTLASPSRPLPQEGDGFIESALTGEIYDSRKSFTVLLIGYHNSGTDTMMLAHVDGEREKVSLISIPRDLWWEGRKINSYYFGFSRETLLEVMSQISGVRVDYYMAIDMYAFIDVVNAMGGIDITLDKAVIDPTYRVIREDGTEGTLYYPPGAYHLNGVEALRLARSRHGSSDFDRSALQQKILGAMKAGLVDLSLRDAGAFRRFLSIGLDNTETNMSLAFMARELLAARNYTLDGGNTLYDKSVLYNTYSNYYLLSEAEKARAREDEDFSWGQWILLPRNGDWGLVRSRVAEILGL